MFYRCTSYSLVYPNFTQSMLACLVEKNGNVFNDLLHHPLFVDIQVTHPNNAVGGLNFGAPTTIPHISPNVHETTPLTACNFRNIAARNHSFLSNT